LRAPGEYPVEANLDGKHTQVKGMLANTNTDTSDGSDGGGSVASETCGNAGINSNTVAPDLFFYAADGDHVNEWIGQFNSHKSPAVGFHFPQEAFKEMKWVEWAN
jgi:hypothetical protein